MARAYMQGKYRPINPGKYRGDVTDIVFRSSWELVAFKFCDMTPEILAWNSENTVIKYISPVDGKPHRYFIDLTIWAKQTDGRVGKFLVEIKPYAQTQVPRNSPNKKQENYVKECHTYLVNKAKWKAATSHAATIGGNFIVWTEKQLFPSQQKMRPMKRAKK